MSQARKITPARLKTILERQSKPRWGSEYLPSILATRSEAPAISRASILTPAKLGREMHLLSSAERKVAMLALYHSDVVEIHEQKMLNPISCRHPAASMPGFENRDLPTHRGMIAVAEELGFSKLLPTVSFQKQDSSKKLTIVFPYIGDLLLFLRRSGRIHCVNWSIKNTEDGFKRPLDLERLNPNQSNMSNESVMARHQLEKNYYRDASINTHLIAAEKIDNNVVCNLTQLFLHHRRTVNLDPSLRIDLVDSIRIAIEYELPPHVVIINFCARWNVSFTDCATALWQSIWNRDIRVDLFRPVLIDRPLRPEVHDVLDVYSDWFV